MYDCDGGGVGVFGDVTVGGCVIKDNTGGGVCLIGGTGPKFTMKSGEISGNTSYGVRVFKGTADISGGIFDNDVDLTMTAESGSTATAAITGGSFEGSVGIGSTAAGTNTLTITGGGFSKDPTTYLAADAPYYLDEEAKEGYYTVVKGFKSDEEFIDFGSSLGFTLYLKADNAYTTVDGFEYTLTGADEDVTRALTVNADLPGVLNFTADGIAAKEMRDEITFTVTKGDVTYFTKTISIYDAVKAWYDAAEDGEYKTMLADMLNYGRAAQDAFDYNKENMGTELTTSTTPNWGEADPTHGVTSGYEDKVAATLSLKDRIELNFYVDDSEAVVYTADPTHTATVENGVQAKNGSSITRISFRDIAVKDVADVLNFTVKLSDGSSFEVKYSIVDYVIDALAGDQRALIQALQKYVDSVAAYLG